MRTDYTDDQDLAAAEESPALRRSRWPLWKIVLFLLVGVLVLLIAVGWFSRETIVRNVIDSELEPLGIPARYKIESIGPHDQILTDVVIGDPARPDFTADRVVVGLQPRLGIPQIESVRLVRPRLYGRYFDGKFSFGSLDPLIFTGSKEPFSLPDMRLVIEDGRARIESQYGTAGIKLAGAGHLRGGFAGTLAAVAPNVAIGDCTVHGASLYGSLSVTSKKPHFKGPVRLSDMQCGREGVRLAKSAMEVDATASEVLDAVDGHVSLNAGRIAMGDYRLARAGGTIRFALGHHRTTARYDINARQVDTPQLRAPNLGLVGTLRAIDGFDRIDVESEVDGNLSGLGKPLIAALDTAAKNAGATLIGDIARQFGDALARETRGATLSGRFIARRSGAEGSLVVPRADVRAKGGASLLSVSRLQLATSKAGLQNVSGNFSTGGNGIPRISGRFTRKPAANLEMSVRMAEYRAGSARIAIPRLYVVRGKEGVIGVSGEAMLSGALPGGVVENLVLPLEGNWSDRRGLAMWRSCTVLRFDRLTLAQLTLGKRALRVCPAQGSAIVRSTPQGIKIAGGVASLDLAGKLGETQIRIASDAVGFAWPGNLDARGIDVTLGPAQSASKFRIAHLAARLDGDLAGSFDDGQVLLAAVPLDMKEVSGKWRYADGALSLSEGSLRLEDRQRMSRFQPVVAHDAMLTLADNVITAQARFREPQSEREVVRAVIIHDLATGRGNADLIADGVIFDKHLQPDTLTRLALGVVANAKGVVSGTGRIAWNEAGVTSTGRFATDDLDFAAAFGPVTGVSGTIEFTDLLSLVTAPGQTLRVKAINPGIEVDDGVITYRLAPGNVLEVAGGIWPFMGGTLRLEPVSLELGSDAPMRYVLTIEGLDAALFLQRLELGNLAATGIFDGRMPLIFDENGGRIETGFLDSRPPGGNVAYVGELTYKDLSPMANFAFDALRSIDYRQMRIDMDGSLEGEIVTRVTFDGISQGEGASRNFLTRRVAKLPIRFRVNLRAPFMQLITSVRSLYDRDYIRDPRTLGIVDATGAPIEPASPAMPVVEASPAIRPAEPSIQRSESDEMP